MSADPHVSALRRRIALAGLVCYLVLLAFLTLRHATHAPIQRLNLLPFRTILLSLRQGGSPFYVNVLGNVAAFMPLGLLVPFTRPRLWSAANIARMSLLVSLSIELIQHLFTARVADIDDVLLNVVGALVGYGGALLLALCDRQGVAQPTRREATAFIDRQDRS